MLALEWSDLDWDRTTLEVSKSLEETKAGLRIKSTKSGEPRRFSIPVKVLDVLRDHKRERKQGQDRALYGSTYADRNLVFARADAVGEQGRSPESLETVVDRPSPSSGRVIELDPEVRRSAAGDHGLTGSAEGLCRWGGCGAEGQVRGGDPRFKAALERDPDFALAWQVLSGLYNNTRQPQLARQCAERAFALRERVTELERLGISKA